MAIDTQVSVTELAFAFGKARETVARRLATAGVKPAGKRRGGPTYALRAAVQAILDAEQDGDPFRRKATLQSEQIETRLAVERGQLIAVDDVRETFAAAFKPIRQALETLPDVLERDAGLTPQQIARCEQVLDALREDLHGELLKVSDARPRK